MNTAESLRNTCLVRRNEIYGRRIDKCRYVAEEAIANIVNQLFTCPTIDTEHHPVLWQESLRRACDEGNNYIEIDITHVDEYISCNGTDSYPYEDKINIITGNYILDKNIFEPMYIQGAPRLISAIITRLGEGFTVDTKRDGERRLLMISVNLYEPLP